MKISPLQHARNQYQPKTPAILSQAPQYVAARYHDSAAESPESAGVRELFPLTYGRKVVEFVEGENASAGHVRNVAVILSGGQAPGGHNVITGILDGLKAGNPDSKLFGFRKGPGGILADDCVELGPEFVAPFRNTGGFDMIGSGRTKLETEEQFQRTAEVLAKRNICALVVIGGDDSNTNAGLLAEYLERSGSQVQVIGVPKTIDGDLKNEQIEVSFGFDTATKTYAELIGNIARDANSAKKYWHFIKLMGRSASHIALECALQTRPNVCLISEEVAEKAMTLDDIVDEIVTTIVKRASQGREYGIVLVPEGLIEAIPEMNTLIGELNTLLAENEKYFSTLTTFEDQAEWVNRRLSRDSSYVFSSLPNEIQRQLLMDRDPHGNVQVSRIETEALLVDMTTTALRERKAKGGFEAKFSSQTHFFGYEGRCAFPSNFDSDYCYSLGRTAALLIQNDLNGYIATVKGLAHPAESWKPGGAPLSPMMNLERRHGKDKPVIRKALVETSGAPFLAFAQQREAWAIETEYRYPGAIQYYGPSEVCDAPNLTLKLEQGLE